MSRAPRLRGQDAVYGILNGWNDTVSSELDTLDTQVSRLSYLQEQSTDTITQFQTDANVPPNISSPSVVAAATVIDGTVYNTVTCTYTTPSPLLNFAGVFLVLKNYNGSAQLVKVAEDTYFGPPGGSKTFKVNLLRTGETVTCYFVAKNATEVTADNWATAPNTTVVLNVYPALLVPSGLTATADALGVRLAWTDNAPTNTVSYNVYRFTSNTPSSGVKIASVPANGVGTQTYYDKSASTDTLYFYWITSVSANGSEGAKSSGASNAGLGPGTHSSYRPTSNPLTATDAGATATITIAAFNMQIGGLSVAYNSGSITALAYSTLYFIYLTDSGFTGGAVSYNATTTKSNAINAYGQLFVGSIITPKALASDTIGFNDGGAGAQSGNTFIVSPTLWSPDGGTTFFPTGQGGGGFPATFSRSASDGDNSTFGSALVAGPPNITILFSGFPSFATSWKSITFKAKLAWFTDIAGTGVKLDVSTDNLGTFTNVLTVGAGANTLGAPAVSTFTVPVVTPLGAVTAKFTLNGVVGGNSRVDIYELWMESQI